MFEKNFLNFWVIKIFLLRRRFHNSLTKNEAWNRERSHEAYAKNYSMVFPNDEPLAARNMRKDPFHEVSLRGATCFF